MPDTNRAISTSGKVTGLKDQTSGGYNSDDHNSRDPGRVLTVLVIILLALMPVAAIAGGLGIAPLAAIGGGASLLVSVFAIVKTRPLNFALWSRLTLLPAWAWALSAFMAWVSLTRLWSPYEDPDRIGNAWVLILGAILFLAFNYIVKHVSRQRPDTMERVVFGMSSLLAVALLIDFSTHYGLTFLVDPLAPGEDIVKKRGDAEMNTGHGITVLALWLPASIMIGIAKFKGGKGLAAGLTIAAILGAYMGGLASGVIAMTLGAFVMGVSYYRPYLMTKIVTALGCISLIFAPLLGHFMAGLTAVQKSKLPFSWEHRAEMWAYVSHKIAANPVIGYGFDASRTFTDTFESRGFSDISIVSLHPHNAGLQIWLETGVIGAVLAAVTLFLLGRQILRRGHNCRYNNRYEIMVLNGFMMSTILLCNVSYGVWQDWWWAAIITAAALSGFPLRPRSFRKKRE